MSSSQPLTPCILPRLRPALNTRRRVQKQEQRHQAIPTQEPLDMHQSHYHKLLWICFRSMTMRMLMLVCLLIHHWALAQLLFRGSLYIAFSKAIRHNQIH